MRKYLSYIIIAETSNDVITSTVQSRHRSNFYSCYTIKLKHYFNGYLSINQWEKRLFPERAAYNYSAFRVIIEKRPAKKKGEYITSGKFMSNLGFSHNRKTLDLQV